MASLNKCIFIGNLGRDPETRYLPNGDAVTNISIGVTESWKDKNTGEKKEQTEWIRVTFYRKLAEIAGQYLKKGFSVYVEGQMKTRKFTDKDGVEKYVTEIIADSMQMLGSPQGGGGRQQADEAPRNAGRGQQRGQQEQRSNQGGGQRRPAPNHSDFDDDIPFANPYRGKYSYAF